jgi:hypothetical protein
VAGRDRGGGHGDPVDGVRRCTVGSVKGPAAAVTTRQPARDCGTKLSRKFRGLELKPIQVRGHRLKCSKNEIRSSPKEDAVTSGTNSQSPPEVSGRRPTPSGDGDRQSPIRRHPVVDARPPTAELMPSRRRRLRCPARRLRQVPRVHGRGHHPVKPGAPRRTS